ncbi:hypothetical protein AO924_34650 [Pseudomonas aeruginosa]|nr:hypothetical protein AO924_34650 [Pseudomonas aeruginosa]OPE16916.1 hypothetical protein APA79_31625 [Pseudomonas aeruginosa]
MVRESLEPGQSVSVVARRNGINPNQLLHWRKLYQDEGLTVVSAGETVVPASELADALTQTRKLQRILGKKTMEAVSENAVGITQVEKLLHDEEGVVCADADYTGLERREEHARRKVIWQIAVRRSTSKTHCKRSVLYKAPRNIEKAKVQV